MAKLQTFWDYWTYLVGKIKFKLFFQGPLAECVCVCVYLLLSVYFTKHHPTKSWTSQKKHEKQSLQKGEHMLYLLCGAESTSREYFWCRPLSSWKSLKLGYLKFPLVGFVGWFHGYSTNPPLTYPPQKYGFNKALLRETNG